MCCTSRSFTGKRQPLGLTKWASCCPQLRRALRVSVAREQCLEMTTCSPRALGGALKAGSREIMRETSLATTLRSPSPRPAASGAHAAAGGGRELRSAAGSPPEWLRTGKTGRKQPLTRGADAGPTSSCAASMSATQLTPASGPPASASRFAARIRPSPAKGDAGTDLLRRSARIRGGSAAAVAGRVQAEVQTAAGPRGTRTAPPGELGLPARSPTWQDETFDTTIDRGRTHPSSRLRNPTKMHCQFDLTILWSRCCRVQLQAWRLCGASLPFCWFYCVSTTTLN